MPTNARWSHIYLMVGWPPFKPKRWAYCVPTLQHAKLGWDVIQGIQRGENFLPELGEVPPYAQSEIVKIEPEKKDDKYKTIKDKFKVENLAATLVNDVVIAAITTVLVSKMVDMLERRIFGERK